MYKASVCVCVYVCLSVCGRAFVGSWKEPDLISVQTEIGGENAQPKSGVSIGSQLVWLYRMQVIYLRQLDSSIYLFFNLLVKRLRCVSFTPLLFFCMFLKLGLEQVLQAVTNFLGKQRNGTGEFFFFFCFFPSQRTFPLPLPLRRISFCCWKTCLCWDFKNPSLRSGVATCLTD